MCIRQPRLAVDCRERVWAGRPPAMQALPPRRGGAIYVIDGWPPDFVSLGIDPGLRRTGWGLIDVDGNRLIYVACGSVATSDKVSLAERLV